MTDSKAWQLGSRFCLPPNSLGYCGRGSAVEKFKKCITLKQCQGIESEFSKFLVLNPYLKTLAQFTHLPLYSYQVIESYWLGNKLLKLAKAADYSLLLENFSAQGIPSFLIEELKQKKPLKFIPHHLFQVLHVGVGRASNNVVPFNLDSINNCMIRWGKVIGIQDNNITVNLNSLKKKGSSYQLTIKMVSLLNNLELVKKLKVGDTVAVHWQQLIKILTKREEKNLAFWTQEVLNSVNGS